MSDLGILQPDKINIVDFKIINGSLSNPFGFKADLLEGHQFDVNFDLGFNIEDKLVKADFEVSVFTKSKEEQDEVSGKFHFVFVFLVENLEQLVIEDKDKKSLTINGDLGNALASICYSTSRGILMSRFQGTPLKDFILPVIDPNQLLK
ncbi:hypothetical protein SAMN00777080_0611 [Aquiflexum balticum DSM 16537]|uniref:Preprotein translocase subunit SecB n=1 Tax=Aquiflexum balticum DSM 16537 TaxID=758820 RepID=A0A1W2GZX2_9BACT|nr:hypothetical protein [Aquiflexum balticum]SMD42074.1 hypothetical protein SAMN00777080_0611 [Aquiflexum balticum DSM 16537]